MQSIAFLVVGALGLNRHCISNSHMCMKNWFVLQVQGLVCLTGPGSPNVHAEYVELQGTVNSFTTSGLNHLKSRIVQVLCVDVA